MQNSSATELCLGLSEQQQYFLHTVNGIYWSPFIPSQKQAVVLKHNKPHTRVAHRGIARFLGIDQNVIRSSHGHSTPSLKFHANRSSRFLVILLTKKQRNKDTHKLINKQRKKSIENKRRPRCIGMYRGGEVINSTCKSQSAIETPKILTSEGIRTVGSGDKTSGVSRNTSVSLMLHS